jgi:transcriptional antiterminator NusG
VKSLPIYALRTTIGQEHSLSEHLARRAENRSHLNIYSVLVPGGLKGYIFVEAGSIDDVELLVEGMRHVRKRPRASRAEEIPISELDHFLIPRPVIKGVDINDIVEVINGPFKGSRARVLDINVGKEEVTVELLAMDLQIPVTISGESIRVIEKATEKEAEEEYLL